MVKMWEEIMEQPEVLTKCFNNNKKTISDIVENLRRINISSVVVAARGTSDHAGIFGKYIIECELGIPVSMAAPSVTTVYNRKLKLYNSLVIGVSQSGKAADVLEVIKDANACGAVTISITNDPKSPLATEAKYHLYCNAGLEKSVAATKTCTTEMYLLAQLVAEWSGNEEMKKEILTIPENISKMFIDKEEMEGKVERYRLMNECFVLARGINYSIAMEAALKIQEDMGDCSIRIPQTNNDIISPFYNVVIAQMFACSLSLLKGLNPDAPRGLNKITITK